MSLSPAPVRRNPIPVRDPVARIYIARLIEEANALTAAVDYLRRDRADLIHELATRDDYIWTLERECDALRAAVGLRGVPE